VGKELGARIQELGGGIAIDRCGRY
jgi:hypothetical protein